MAQINTSCMVFVLYDHRNSDARLVHNTHLNNDLCVGMTSRIGSLCKVIDDLAS